MKIILPYHSSPMVHSAGSFPRIWKPPHPCTLKGNINVSFSEGKMGIDVLVRNHLGIPLLGKTTPHLGRYSVDYGELLVIIEGCIIGSRMEIESDSHIAVNCLSSCGDDF